MPLFRNINFGMRLLAVAMLDLHVKACSDNEFTLPDSICCTFCPEGRFKNVNCTRNSNGYVASGHCKECSKCADGMQMITPCTKFADTHCAVKENITAILSTMVTPTISEDLGLMNLALYATATVAFIVIIAAVVYKWYTTRRISRDPAEEPFKIMV